MLPESGCYEHSHHLTPFNNYPFCTVKNPALCVGAGGGIRRRRVGGGAGFPSALTELMLLPFQAGLPELAHLCSGLY